MLIRLCERVLTLWATVLESVGALPTGEANRMEVKMAALVVFEFYFSASAWASASIASSEARGMSLPARTTVRTEVVW
jgi:hypothetical protein